jgi:hypothetical protein
VSLVLETGEAREMHHFAVLIGYGANAIDFKKTILEKLQEKLLTTKYLRLAIPKMFS